MRWPCLLEYSEAIVNPRQCFADKDLIAAAPDCDSRGFAISIVGNFAGIYKLKGDNRNWAVKCFLRGVADQRQRYLEIQQHFGRNSTENTIAFEYIPAGMHVRGERVPIVKNGLG